MNIISREHVGNYRFDRISYSSPEQYHIFDKNDQWVAYIRVRWGNLNLYKVNADRICWDDGSIFSAPVDDRGWAGEIPEKLRMSLFLKIVEELESEAELCDYEELV